MNTILLPIDGSQGATHLINWCADLFDVKQSQFILLYVDEQHEGVRKHPQGYETIAKEILETAARQLQNLGATAPSTEYRVGDPVKEICKAADDLAVDLVLMGSHGRTALAKAMMGSVSEGVVHHCKHSLGIFKTI